MVKLKKKSFTVLVDLKLNVGFEVAADSLQDAVIKASAMKMSDIVDFGANGWDHNDSDSPVVTGVFTS